MDFLFFTSMIFSESINLYFPWRVAPKIESIIAEKNPDNTIPKTSITDIEKRRNAEDPIIAEPINEPNVPIKVIPPDSPCFIVLNEIIDLGLDLDNLPNSVAHVSDIAAAIEELNNKIFKEEGWK